MIIYIYFFIHTYTDYFTDRREYATRIFLGRRAAPEPLYNLSLPLITML